MRTAGLLFLAVALLASCGEVRWQKAGPEDAALAQDLSACRKLAQERITRMYGPPVLSSHDPRFGPDTTRPGPAERQMSEEQAFGACMRDKGYALTTSPGGSPAAPSGAAR
jgi:hypothetical protein